MRCCRDVLFGPIFGIVIPHTAIGQTHVAFNRASSCASVPRLFNRLSALWRGGL
jgi:hypothetical protein